MLLPQTLRNESFGHLESDSSPTLVTLGQSLKSMARKVFKFSRCLSSESPTRVCAQTDLFQCRKLRHRFHGVFGNRRLEKLQKFQLFKPPQAYLPTHR